MFRKYALKNKMRLVLSEMHETKALTLLMLFRVGSRYEERRTLGISHFLEHMMFKGTKKRPKAIQISRLLDGIGAEYNAFTGKDYTGYYIKANYEKAGVAADLMSDMLANSIMAETEVERERKVIQEEINMYEDNPMMLVEELFEEELYNGSSLGWRIAGDADSLANIKRDELASFRYEHYRPKNAVLVAAGRFPKDLEKTLEKNFGMIRGRDGLPKKFRNFRPAAEHSRGARVKLKFKDTGQVQVALGFPSYGYGDPRLAALKVLAVILGGTMSSRLFIAVRERRGLAYFVRAGVNTYQDTGNFMVQAGLDKSRVQDALKVIMAEIKKAAEGGVSAGELLRAKENIRGRMALALEESSDVADFLGKQELLSGKIRTPDERLEEVFAVRREDILKAAKEVFNSRKLAAAIIGPFDDADRFSKILKI